MNAREAAFKILCDIEIEKNYSNMAINNTLIWQLIKYLRTKR